MAKTGNIQERYFRPDGAELNSPDQIEVFKEMPKFFKNVVVCWPRMHFGVFVHDGARVHQMNVKEEWNNEGIVGGVEKEVKEQFVALAWPRFDTDEDMGVHLFSMDGKNMRDYVVGKQPTVVVLTSADDLVNKSTDDCAF